ncbi:prepilin-type N-terminal cleavage/methylation domain-containing protein [Candidatus Saccharibacteria bacterium]|nr:prepilin-type N-terminal cleavage/methylation domain-containing protein [Candidatus Saccharibacteria bacterium]MCB9821235.1 prepilin-type N-terminal cleavage/methylation domain-containing protein [Candidatus Nomurabacteria bacterium]
MTPRALQKNKEGFTIIEVMIVLAIAGLIILIVFLAVPALQRNSRNTQRRNDAARVSGLLSEYTTNNNGRLPANSAALQALIGTQLSIYDVTSITLAAATEATGNDAAAAASSNSTVVVVSNATCSDNNAVAGGGSRAYTVTFAVETSGGGSTAQCL